MKQQLVRPTSIAKVIKVHVSADGRVRAAYIEYKLPGESVFRTTTRPIHKLVLAAPVEEQAAAGDQEKEEIARTDEPAPLAIGEPGLPQQEEVRAAEKEEDLPNEDPQGATPQLTKEKQEKPKVAVKYKKVISWKKAGEQARTIVVSVPKVTYNPLPYLVENRFATVTSYWCLKLNKNVTSYYKK
jgi:hypothetical protein